MANKDVDEIVVGANGTIWVAPVGTATPITPTATPVGWTDLGFASEDGVTATDSKTLQDIPVWQLFYSARKIVTARDFMLKFVLRQWSRDTVALAFGGGDVVQPDAYANPDVYRYDPPSPEDIDERAMMLDWVDGDKNYRWVLPRGLVTENVETNITRTAAADLPITFGVIGQQGVGPWYLLTDDPSFAP